MRIALTVTICLLFILLCPFVGAQSSINGNKTQIYKPGKSEVADHSAVTHSISKPDDGDSLNGELTNDVTNDEKETIDTGNSTHFNKQAFENELGMTFVRISPGSFLMGSSLSEPGRKENEDIHPFNILKPYYIQTTEVTEKQWFTVMGENPAYFQSLCGENCPIEKVSWFDVQEYITKLNKDYAHPFLVYRLPTEAEWEFAARAGTQRPLYNGDLLNPYNRDYKLDKIAWYWDNSGKRPHQVAQKEPNAWGIFDMLGNVWEWCQDWYDVRYLYGIEKDVDEPLGDKLRVVRGGGWYSFAWRNRCASRDGAAPSKANGDVGFRLVAEPKIKPNDDQNNIESARVDTN